MYGRNGVDNLNRFIFFLYIIALIVYLFVQHYSVLIIETVLLIIYILIKVGVFMCEKISEKVLEKIRVLKNEKLKVSVEVKKHTNKEIIDFNL